MGFLLLLLSLLLPASLSAQPVTLHVDAVNGSDSGDGSEANPLATIGAALELAVAGDEIEVAAGVYLEDVVAKDEVDLEGAGADVTLLDGGFTCAAARVTGFELRGGGSCAAPARIERNLMRGKLTISAGEVEIDGNVFLIPLPVPLPLGATDGAIHVVAGTGVVITGNSFFGTYGINLEAGSQAAIANNLLVRGRRGIELAAGATAEIRHNDVFGNRQGIIGFRSNYIGIADQTGSNGNLSVEPGFVDAEEGDFRLRAASPLIDAGSNPDVILDQDFAGGTRILDGDGDTSAEVDAGAQEFDPEEELPLDVEVDVLNTVRLRWIESEKPERHKLRVAILSSSEFSAPDEIDLTALRLGASASLRCRVKDANRDDRDDWVCKFPAAGISIGTFPFGTPTACVRGLTFAGRKLLGCDEVGIVP